MDVRLKKLIDFQKLDKPLSFRVPHETHIKYKSLSGFKRKEIQYKFNKWIERQLKKEVV